MAVRRYEIDELLTLRESPLVKKPEDLPAIEQWLEYVYMDKDSREKLRIPHSEAAQQQPQQQKDANPRSRAARPANNGEASPMGNFSTGQRPSLLQTRSHVSKNGEDIVLGPPKTAFASSSKLSRLSGTPDAQADGQVIEENEGGRGKSMGDRQQNRKSAHAGDKEGRDNRDSWRERRVQGDVEEQKDGNDRFGKFGRRDREHDGERRNGDKGDNRWGHRDDKRQNGERQGGWRERESNRQNKDWERGQRVEKEPEWFDEPVELKKQEADLGMSAAHTQEDFQKWKEMMKGNKAPAEEPVPVEPPPPAKQAAPTKPTTAPFGDSPFGGFGVQSPDASIDGLPPATKPSQAKGKSSRFASMFKKEEAPAPAPVPPPAEETPVQRIANEVAQNASEDKAGFQRILQMLGGTGISQPQVAMPPSEPSSPQPRVNANGGRQKSRFFDAAPKSPERFQSPQSGLPQPFGQPGNGLTPSDRNVSDEPSGMFGFGLPEKNTRQPVAARSQPHSNLVSPNPLQSMQSSRDSLPPQHRPIDHDPPSRGASTPDVNIQNLLAAQRARVSHAPDKNSEFLLGLLQSQPSRPSSQQPRPSGDFNPAHPWLNQPPPEPHAPKPRAPPPPGLIDDHLLRNTSLDMAMQEQLSMQGQDIPTRRTSQRVPPPGFDEQAMFMQQQQMQQRRNFAEPQHQMQPPPSRRMSGHPNFPGLPPQLQGQFSPDFPLMQSSGGQQQGPPPGFPPNMRHPQGFANTPNIFQAPQPQQQPREPPGFGGMIQSPMSPPGPPPGFGAGIQGMPPGLAGMRGPNNGMPGGVHAGAGFQGAGRGYDGFDGMSQRR